MLFRPNTGKEAPAELLELRVSERVKLAFLSGYFMQVAHLQKSGVYAVFQDPLQVLIHPSCSFKTKPEFVLYLEFVLTQRNYIRTVTDVNPVWLVQFFPDVFNPEGISRTETKRALENARKALKTVKPKK